ncbi:LUD domain-containing protein [Halobaculum sp. CBA1158]|uniref:LutC/YkgG family protein n=1 Tax=Halobaculum sp. CBA1158 TaxID=2904243 RepID=UPI001F43E2AB|nr:LUD domain-containing protein [Halobaculum sp. CBA1158]UIO98804.1 LUD domain-containing protein [Halobaculum sp. CBA1158]
MQSDTPDECAAFVANAERHHAAVHRVDPDPDAVASAIADLVAEPAVGVRLPGGLSLPDGVATDPTPADLDAAVTGVTAATLAVADYGSVVVCSDAAGTEAVSLFPDRHVAVVRAGDVVPGMREAMGVLGDRLRAGESAVIATGPSATADMGDLVVGAHGPREVEIVLVEGDRE